jgi:transcriptional regulator with XRE-family HTH domain
MSDLKDLIRGRRIEVGKTLEDVAREVGVAKATVQRWETGEIKDMRRDKLVSLARALETTPAYLMGWSITDKTYEQIKTEDQAIIDAFRRASPEIQQAILRILEGQ